MAMCCFWLSILCSVCYDVCHHRHVRYKGTVAAILMKLSALWHCEDALQVCSPIHRYYANGTYQKSAPEKKRRAYLFLAHLTWNSVPNFSGASFW